MEAKSLVRVTRNWGPAVAPQWLRRLLIGVAAGDVDQDRGYLPATRRAALTGAGAPPDLGDTRHTFARHLHDGHVADACTVTHDHLAESPEWMYLLISDVETHFQDPIDQTRKVLPPLRK